MAQRCPECGGSVNVDSLCTFAPAREQDGFGWKPVGDFQPEDDDSAHCQNDDCGWEGTYADLS